MLVLVGRAEQGRRGFYYQLAASDLISDAAAVAAGGARARGEAAAAAAAKAASDLLPPLDPFCCRQHRKCLRWCRGRAMMPSITSASDGSSGIGSGRRCRLHSAFVAAARPLPKTAAGWWRLAADDRKRNLFWSKPQLDRDQDQGLS